MRTRGQPSCAAARRCRSTRCLSRFGEEGLLALLAAGLELLPGARLWVLTLAALLAAVDVGAVGPAMGQWPVLGAAWPQLLAGCRDHPPGGRPQLSGPQTLHQRPAAGAALHPAAGAHRCRGAAGRQVMLGRPSWAPVAPSLGSPAAGSMQLSPVSPSDPTRCSPVLPWRACTLPASQRSWTATRSQWKSRSRWTQQVSACSWRKLTLCRAMK